MEASALLYPDELVASRAAACIDVGDAPPRSEASLRKVAQVVSYGSSPPQATTKQGGAGASAAGKLRPIGSDLEGGASNRAPPFSPVPRTESSRGGPLPGEISRGKSSWIFRDSKTGTEDGEDDDSIKSEKARPVNLI